MGRRVVMIQNRKYVLSHTWSGWEIYCYESGYRESMTSRNHGIRWLQTLIHVSSVIGNWNTTESFNPWLEANSPIF